MHHRNSKKIGELEWYRDNVLGTGINTVYNGRFSNTKNQFNKVGSIECAVKRIYNCSSVIAEEREIKMFIKLTGTAIGDIPLAMFYHFEEDADFW